MAHREKVRAEAAKLKGWPPDIMPFIKNMTLEIFTPYSFSPLLTPGKHGPLYEYRYYQIFPGMLGENKKRWERALPKRLGDCQLGCATESELGTGNKFVHIWHYKDPNHGMEVRTKTEHDGVWPPKGDDPKVITVLDQQNKLLYPAPFSPMQ